MKTLRPLALLTLVSVLPLHAAPKSEKLTPQKLAELNSADNVPKYAVCGVAIDGMSLPQTITGDGLPNVKNGKNPPAKKEPLSIHFKTDGNPATIELIRELRFPSAFESAKADPQNAGNAVTPTTPTEFETINTGWSIKFTARQQGKLLAVTGVADYTEAELLPGGYGQAAQPIYSSDGKLLTPNKLMQPKVQTTTSRFCLLAVPGEPCEVTLFRGQKAEKHTVTITAP